MKVVEWWLNFWGVFLRLGWSRSLGSRRKAAPTRLQGARGAPIGVVGDPASRRGMQECPPSVISWRFFAILARGNSDGSTRIKKLTPFQ